MSTEPAHNRIRKRGDYRIQWVWTMLQSKRNTPNLLDQQARDVDVFSFSLIRTITVGSGLSPDLLTSTNRALAGSPNRHTAGGEFRPALRIN